LKIFLLMMLIALTFSACGGGGPSIDARVLQLNLTYSFDGPSAAVLSAGNGAASAGSEVQCRLTAGGRPVIGLAVAGETGAFEMELDLELLPQQLPDGDTFRRLNETVECRSGNGSWVNPLRQPRLEIE
jgi:hypothetical protein